MGNLWIIVQWIRQDTESLVINGKTTGRNATKWGRWGKPGIMSVLQAQIDFSYFKITLEGINFTGF